MYISLKILFLTIAFITNYVKTLLQIRGSLLQIITLNTMTKNYYKLWHLLTDYNRK